jgi:hypothetical protein
MKKCMSLAFVSAIVACPALATDSHVVPNGYADAPGTATFLFLTTGERTYQMIIHEDQLTDLVGRDLMSVTWRLPGIASVDWPATDANFTNFDIHVGPGVAPEDRTLVFTDNYAGPQTQVRSGPLTIPAGSFTHGFSPNPFGFRVQFDTPWLYAGGHLIVEIRRSGHDATTRSMDSVGTSPDFGYGTQFAAVWQSNYQPVGSGTQGNFVIVEIASEPGTPDCPADLTGDGNVGVPDLLALLACWGPVTPGAGCEAADLTGNGSVGVPDLLELLANWGPCP